MTLLNDKKNTRGKDGRHSPKRIQITSKEHVCKFIFAIKADEFGFYIHLQRNAGQPIHNDHPKPFDPSLIPLPTQLLGEQEKDNILNVVESTCDKAQGRNFTRGKFRKFINSLKVDYLFQKSKQTEDLSDDIECMLDDLEKSEGISLTTLSDVRIHEYLEKLLSQASASNDVNNSSATMTIQTSKKKNGFVVNEPINDDEDLPSLLPIQSIAHKERVEQKS